MPRDCNKLKKTNILLAKILRKSQDSGKSTHHPLICLGCLEIHISLSILSIDISESLLIVVVLPSLVYPHFKLDVEQDEICKLLLITQDDFALFC